MDRWFRMKICMRLIEVYTVMTAKFHLDRLNRFWQIAKNADFRDFSPENQGSKIRKRTDFSRKHFIRFRMMKNFD